MNGLLIPISRFVNATHEIGITGNQLRCCEVFGRISLLNTGNPCSLNCFKRSVFVSPITATTRRPYDISTWTQFPRWSSWTV